MIAIANFDKRRDDQRVMDDIIADLNVAEKKWDEAAKKLDVAIADYVTKNGKPSVEATYATVKKKIEQTGLPIHEDTVQKVAYKFNEQLWGSYNPECQK